MEQMVYPAIFHKNDAQGYWVEFPDIPGCVSEGKSLEEAFLMAGDALFCWFDDASQARPKPTPLSDIKLGERDIVQMVQPAPYLSDEAKQFCIREAIEKGLEMRNLNKYQMATILNVDRSYITYIVKGKKTPSPDMAKRIGLLLGFDWQIFYA